MVSVKSDKIITDDGLFDGYISLEGGKISALTCSDPGGERYDFTGYYVSAGFIDMHVHGGAGADFTDCTEEEAMRAVAYHRSRGTTCILPTTLAADCERTERALTVLRNAKERGAKEIAGAHIEGPYFSPAQAGAQNACFLTDPIPRDYEKILSGFGNFVRKWSYAPERDHGGVFCKYLTEHGVVASAGHTSATYSDFSLAYKNGLRSVTHLYSCTSTITREKGYRILGVTECAYLFEDVVAELIADGRHIPPELIRLVFKLKGASRIALVTDCLSVSGSGKDAGILNGIPYVVEDGVAKLTDRSAFAGSISSMDDLVRECVRAGVPLSDAVRAATKTPARLLHLKKGKIAAGYDADLVVFDENISVRAVFVDGQAVSGEARNG